jgi:uncharacterized protein (DUF2235 family)
VFSRSKRGQQDQALGYSRGGFSTKVHGVCDALGNPLGFILSAGQAADCKYALPLITKANFDPNRDKIDFVFLSPVLILAIYSYSDIVHF